MQREFFGMLWTISGKERCCDDLQIRCAGSYPDSPICDVVVVVRGQEMVLRCRDYRQAMRWARIERKTYKIPKPDIDVATKAESGDLPLFLRSDSN
jgi:hypothetical protein